jgi:voltage-gated sodium channel
MASITALLALVLYVSGIIATKLFSEVAPKHFGDLGDSLFTLFQVMTGDAWSDVSRAVMEQQPFAWVFFIGFLVVTSFTVLNLFIAVAVSAMENQVSAERDREESEAKADVLAEIRGLRAELQALRGTASDLVPDAQRVLHHDRGTAGV